MTTTAPPIPIDGQTVGAATAEDLWSMSVTVNSSARSHRIPLTNFAGRNYPSLHNDMMMRLLRIAPEDRVLDVGGGDSPFKRANVVTDAFPDDSIHRSGRSAKTADGQEFVACFAESLPFEDNSFDVVYSRAVLEHVTDPASACRELMRVGKRGYIETPSPIAEYLGGHPTHRWLTWVERVPGREPVFVFRRKPFLRAPFRWVMRRNWFASEDFRLQWEWVYRNVSCTQFEWDGSFAFRVEEDEYGIDYDDPAQAAEAHLDTVIQGLRFGGLSSDVALADAEEAVRLMPSWAVAHSTLGCILWMIGRTTQARQEFAEAARLNPNDEDIRFNTQLVPGTQGTAEGTPRLAKLPPVPDELSDIESNFAGKVYYAFVSYDDRLARDLKIQQGERVLDVGGGQRPLKRADVSIDFDVFEGLHRQGQAISREKPLVCGDVQRLPFRTNAFDVVCCRMVLEHVVDPASACRELQRVAKRGFIETPNTLWECFYGHPTHRWIVEWEAPTRTLVFTRKPFDRIPFQSAMVPYLYTQADVQRAFEITHRNIAATQITWDEEHPFDVRVEDDPNCPYDYLNRPEDAARGSMSYARDLFECGLAPVAVAEAEDALRHAPTVALRAEAARLRLQIAEAMGDGAKTAEMRALIRSLSLEPSEAVVRSAVNRTLPVLWQAPLRDPSGYADEARHFLFALDEVGTEVAARAIRWSDKIAVLPPDREQTLNRMLSKPLPASYVSVCHILAPHFQRDPRAHANVGRTMFESDRLPDGWAQACNRMDAVWVPGAFNQETFAKAGVKREKLRIVPGAIDLSPYNPECTPLKIDGARGFNFLSVFDWTLRKGWDVLIQAFVAEFRADEDVALVIKTHSSMGYTIQTVVDQVSAFLTDTLKCDPNKIPDIIFQDTNIPDGRMPNLYRAADCYVMPTHGEGWGRPFMEAMAMGLPVIATNWSGQTAFITNENSLLLDYELVDVPEAAWTETPTYKGHRWAQPSLPHLRRLMRQTFEDRAGGKEIGQRARTHLETHFTYPAVAKIILAELERLA